MKETKEQWNGWGWGDKEEERSNRGLCWKNVTWELVSKDVEVWIKENSG